MTNQLRFDITARPITYSEVPACLTFNSDRILEFNHRHRAVLRNYELHLKEGRVLTLDGRVNNKSNLGSFRNRQLRESVVLAAALPAAAVGLHGCGSLMTFPKEQRTSDKANELKRANDRTAAQIMSEVLQTTADDLPIGEEVLIESRITEGVRMKPGKEVGGNPTIAVGALFAKEDHRLRYGLPPKPGVTLMSMGSDVIDGTTKSVQGAHSSLTALFVTESNIKRHLPDIYVQSWAAGADFHEFNPRSISLTDAAQRIADAYGFEDVSQLGAFFLDRPRHIPAMDELNKLGVATPYDQDGDLFPLLLLGLDGITFEGGGGLNAVIGEIGGSAEWAVSTLPLIWRGGQALGMLTSHSALTRSKATAEQKWKERFHYTEEEFILIQDARFEQKPYFSVKDILEDPFAGGVSAYGAITDNAYLPFMKGAHGNPDDGTVTVWTLVINSMGQMESWELIFEADNSLQDSIELLKSPKEQLVGLSGKALSDKIAELLDNPRLRDRYRIFFNNEYYPALIPVNNRLVVLHRSLNGLIKRGALTELDRDIVDITTELASEWFVPHEY